MLEADNRMNRATSLKSELRCEPQTRQQLFHSPQGSWPSEVKRRSQIVHINKLTTSSACCMCNQPTLGTGGGKASKHHHPCKSVLRWRNWVKSGLFCLHSILKRLNNIYLTAGASPRLSSMITGVPEICGCSSP